MDAAAVLGGELARQHMRRSDLVERIATLNERMAKSLRELGETDLKIVQLQGQIKRVVVRRAEA
jgi:hypothetical protein